MAESVTKELVTKKLVTDVSNCKDKTIRALDIIINAFLHNDAIRHQFIKPKFKLVSKYTEEEQEHLENYTNLSQRLRKLYPVFRVEDIYDRLDAILESIMINSRSVNTKPFFSGIRSNNSVPPLRPDVFGDLTGIAAIIQIPAQVATYMSRLSSNALRKLVTNCQTDVDNLIDYINSLNFSALPDNYNSGENLSQLNAQTRDLLNVRSGGGQKVAKISQKTYSYKEAQKFAFQSKTPLIYVSEYSKHIFPYIRRSLSLHLFSQLIN
jgi:hypothetical protein